VLVGRGGHGQTGLGRQVAAGLDREALGVHRHGHGAEAGGQDRAQEARIARVLHPHRLARVQEDPYGQVQGLLGGARGDDDLVRIAVQGPHGAQVAGNGRTERPVARRLAVGQQRPGRPAPDPAQKPAPNVEGKVGEVGHPVDEGQAAPPYRAAQGRERGAAVGRGRRRGRDRARAGRGWPRGR
jgi:hypothetical protein